MNKKFWKAMKVALAMSTILETTYTFSTPALANEVSVEAGGGISSTVYCGKEEHTHSDECYESVLTCSNEEEGHVHSDECYTTQLTCTKEEHTHSDECYKNPDNENTAEPSTTATPDEDNSGESTNNTTEQKSDSNVNETSTDETSTNNLLDIKDTIEISVSTDESIYRNPTKDDDGNYLYYTGEAPNAYLNISNPTSAKIDVDDGAVVRLYMKFTNASPATGRTSTSGSPKQGEGEYTIEAKSGTIYKYTVTKVEDNTYCFEIARPINGDTINLSLSSIFPNGTSVGGTNEIWAVVLTAEEKEELDVDGKVGIAKKPADGSNQETLKWETKEDEYSVQKTCTTKDTGLLGDGDGGAYVPKLTWNIAFNRSTVDTLEGVGKDYVRYVEYTDEITLPDGAEWDSDFVTIIKEKKYTTKLVYPKGYSFIDNNNSEICGIYTSGTSDSSSKQLDHIKPTLELTDNNKLKITWIMYSKDFNDKTVSDDDIPTKDFSPLTINLNLFEKAIHISNPTESTKYIINNKVITDVNYSWASNKQYSSEVDFEVSVSEANLKMDKQLNSANNYFGGNGTYEITVKNEGVLSYDKLGHIDDQLSNYIYLSSENMISLFNDENFGDKLNITILWATICDTPETKTVTKIDGTTENISVGNTSKDGNINKYNGKQNKDSTEMTSRAEIKIFKENNKIAVQYGEQKLTCDIDSVSLQTALDKLGFINTYDTYYKLRWDFANDETVYKLNGGSEIKIAIPFRYKNTFMFLQSDTDGSYAKDYLYSGWNNAYAYTIENEKITEASKNGAYIYKEYFLTKTASNSDGAILEEMPEDGEIINYTLSVKNKNSYLKKNGEFLPLVDHMSGAQVLLATVSENKDKDWAKNMDDTDIITKNETQYYKLSKVGTYQNVTINGLIADSVTVSKTSEGLDTIIKWYFESVYTNNETKEFTYQALVDKEGIAPGAAKYTLGNESWLGDHESHRLYANMDTIPYLTFSFDKKIVSQDDISASTKEVGRSTSGVGEGETVYYRLTFYPSDASYTINGSSISDALPYGLIKNGTEYLKWNKSESNESGSVWIEEYQGYEDIQNADGYYIEGDKNQQYIKWNDDFSITVGDKPVYIYVRLTFPTEANWQEYCTNYSSTELYNTFYVYGVPSTVSHNTKTTAKAYLQKGVFANLYYNGNYIAGFNLENNSLFYYGNNDSTNRAIAYYAVLYNDGNTRLYVQDMQDILPDGFTFKTLVNNSSDIQQSSWKTAYDSKNIGDFYAYPPVMAKDSSGAKVNWRNAHLKAEIDENDPQKITFKISQNELSNKPENNIKYDTVRKMYYLDPGEGICFGYICATNEYTDTKDTAINSIAMPYYDYNEGGVVVSDSSFTNSYDKAILNPNDGYCNVINNNKASSMGYSGGSDETKWLESEVSVVRGGIKPGITKALTGLITAKGETITGNIVSAYPTDTLCWTITADNDGDYSIVDYVLTDSMPKPYLFNGKVNYRTTNDGTTDERLAYQGYLFDIGELNEEDNTVLLSSNDGATSEKLTINGEFKTLKVYWTHRYATAKPDSYSEIDVQIKESDSEYTLYIRFKDKQFALREHQSGILTLNTKNTTSNLVNSVYVNHCYITPMNQTWDGSVNKGNYTVLDAFDKEKMSTVQNGAPVTTSYGYTTSSIKSITQVGNEENKSDSTKAINYIVLPNKETEFTYTLAVENAKQAIGKMVIIDGLPEIGDHSSFQNDDLRYSEFKVRLADDINMKVTVKLEDNTIKELTEDQYIVEYNTKTEFDSKDWDGSSSWSTDSTNARSLRIKIEDETGELIPAKAILYVSFNAVIDGDANAGQIAWNSFGYHYSVVGSSSELEAAPLKVGVMLPTIPTIQKSLVDSSNNAVNASNNETFKYIIYTGSSLKLSNQEELLNALVNDTNREFTVIETTVKKGKSQTDKIKLDNCKVYTYSDGTLIETDADFTWKNEQQYTVVELPNDSIYQFKSINNNTVSSGYTFTYTANVAYNLSVVNYFDSWNFKVKKVDGEDSSIVLKDAYFALYSLYERDAIAMEDYETLSVKPDKEIEYDDQTWYLSRVSSTDTNGLINWNSLGRDKYLYKEVKAPAQYELNDQMHIVVKTSGENVIEVKNNLAYITLSAKKEWNDTISDGEINKASRPESITVSVKNRDEVVDTLTLSGSNNWSATSKKLLKYDSTGKEIDYKLVEESVDGYVSTSSIEDDGTIKFTNTLTSVSISKVNTDLIALEGAKLQLFEGDTKVDEWISSTTPHVIKGLKIGTTYTLKEIEAPTDYLITNDITFTIKTDGTVQTSADVENGVVFMKDTPIEKTSFTVNKVWVDEDNYYQLRPTSIEVQLTQTLNDETTNVGDPVRITGDSWSYTWNDLPKTDANGNAITYKVAEVSISDKYTSNVSEDGKTITNTLKTGSLTFTKTIDGSVTDSDLKNLSFVISGPNGYSKEVKYSEMTNVVSGKRTYTINSLLPGEYTVIEKNAEVNGYSITTTYKDGASKTVEIDKTSTIDITNQYSKNKEPKKDEPKTVTPEKEYQLVRTSAE